MIVGTAGHIDHGKTALVSALTGIDTDRLPEEKRRGITLELGYAFMPLPDGGRIAFVDMPGHEKLVQTMVSGASGIGYALLLVAADDGIMPQTAEHLTILALLQVRRGAAIITKTDRVDDALLQERVAQVRQLLTQAGLADYPVLCVSALRGDGMDALRELLLREAQRPQPAAPAAAGFRMGLDRAFTLEGIGTIVAGSIAAGAVAIDESLCLAQAPQRHYRVRSLHIHDQTVTGAHAGQRCAVGLAGLERSAAERGQVLCDPAIALATARCDVWLQVAASEEKPLRSGTLVHLHVGTQQRMATVAVLGQLSIAPGQGALAQLVLQQAVHAWQGDRYILRDASARRTLAGGTVLDPDAPARYRQTPERLDYLQTQRAEDPVARLQGALRHARFGMDGAEWLRCNGLLRWPFDPASRCDALLVPDRQWLISRERLAEAENAVLRALQDFHAKYPEEIGPDLQRARRLAAPSMPPQLWTQLTDYLREAGRLGRRNGFLHLPEHGVQLVAAEKALAERALPLLMQGHFDPPWVRDIAASANLPEGQVRRVLARMATGGDVYQVVKDLYYHPLVMQELASIARTLAQAEGGIAAAAFRDATGLGRKRAIQILEFFDRIGFLRRVGDAHLLRAGTALFPTVERTT